MKNSNEKIYGLMRSELGFAQVEVELSLLAGLPRIQFLGLPDAATREAEWRIKSAIKKQGFRFPTSQQVIVNFKPATLRKQLVGVELAVAALLLRAMGQVKFDVHEPLLFSGHLSLTGEVEVPPDLPSWAEWQGLKLVTGPNAQVQASHFCLEKLQDLAQPWSWVNPKVDVMWGPSPDEDLCLTKPQARLLGLLALGGHSAILAGPPGTGKSTLTRLVDGLLPAPSRSEAAQILEIGSYFGETRRWRPRVEPHPTSSIHAILGGGARNRAGELTRAHLGVLILDELLEFSGEVQEGLRTTLESKSVHLVRGERVRTYPGDFQFLATANLCKCGQYLPIKEHSCRCSEGKMKTYSTRISWPLWDRVQILEFLQTEPRVIKVSAVREQVSLARLRPRPRELDIRALDILNDYQFASMRRKNACVAVAETLAWLDGKDKVTRHTLTEAHRLTCSNFFDLRTLKFH